MLNRIIRNLKTYPEDVCYETGGTVYRNKDLYRSVCCICRYLLQNNPQKKAVAVCGHKEFYMLASFLACSCAGMPYVPIDVSVPEARKETILRQIDPDVTIDRTIEAVMEETPFAVLPEISMRDEDVYYIIFTSGSTGEPKGVQITYGNLKSCMRWLERLCGIREGVILNQANYSFDLSVADLYLPLLTRSRHFVPERAIRQDYRLLFEELRHSNADLAIFTPSYLDLLLVDKSFDARLMPRLKTVLLCGEKLTERTARLLPERFPGIRLINCYGPTECTFAVTSAEITDPDDLPIGVPKDDTALYIVDEQLRELGDGETGEILISGASVGKGYLNRDPDGRFLLYKGERAYLTGDYGYRKQGRFYFVGRKDTQIKLSGYRIELAEIENALCRLESVERAVVTTKSRDGKVFRILAFVQLKPSCAVGASEIRDRLKAVLPEYMIPTVKLIDDIPLTPNGKADIQGLLGETE